MEDQEKEDWVSLYQSALVELEQAKITRRISAAREAILARMEILRALPGPHTEERRAIEDALRALAFLQREEARFVEESLEKLRSVGHTIQRLRRKAGPRMKPKHIGVVLAVALVFALSSSA